MSKKFSEHQGNYVLSQVEVMMTFFLFVCLGKANMKTTEITTCVTELKRLKLHFLFFKKEKTNLKGSSGLPLDFYIVVRCK